MGPEVPPSLQLVLEKTPPLIQQSVVTRTGFNNLPYGSTKLNMPLGKIGNTSGAKAGTSSTPKQGEDVGNSKGARPKESED